MLTVQRLKQIEQNWINDFADRFAILEGILRSTVSLDHRDGFIQPPENIEH